MLATYANTDPLSVFIEANGVVSVTLEKLNRLVCVDFPSECTHDIDHTPDLLTPVTLTKAISGRLPELQDLTRAKLLMSAYSAAQMAIASATMSLPTMEPFERSKTATNLLQQVSALSERPKQQTTMNLNQMIFQQLPDEESRQAWLFLSKHNEPIEDVTQESLIIDQN